MKRDKSDRNRIEPLAVPLWPDAGELIGTGKNLTYRMAAEGKIPTIRLGKRILVPLAALRRMMEAV